MSEKNCEICPYKVVFEWAQLNSQDRKTVVEFAGFLSEKRKRVEMTTTISDALEIKSNEWLEKHRDSQPAVAAD